MYMSFRTGPKGFRKPRIGFRITWWNLLIVGMYYMMYYLMYAVFWMVYWVIKLIILFYKWLFVGIVKLVKLLIDKIKARTSE